MPSPGDQAFLTLFWMLLAGVLGLCSYSIRNLTKSSCNNKNSKEVLINKNKHRNEKKIDEFATAPFQNKKVHTNTMDLLSNTLSQNELILNVFQEDALTQSWIQALKKNNTKTSRKFILNFDSSDESENNNKKEENYLKNDFNKDTVLSHSLKSNSECDDDANLIKRSHSNYSCLSSNDEMKSSPDKESTKSVQQKAQSIKVKNNPDKIFLKKLRNKLNAKPRSLIDNYPSIITNLNKNGLSSITKQFEIQQKSETIKQQEFQNLNSSGDEDNFLPKSYPILAKVLSSRHTMNETPIRSADSGKCLKNSSEILKGQKKLNFDEDPLINSSEFSNKMNEEEIQTNNSLSLVVNHSEKVLTKPDEIINGSIKISLDKHVEDKKKINELGQHGISITTNIHNLLGGTSLLISNENKPKPFLKIDNFTNPGNQFDKNNIFKPNGIFSKFPEVNINSENGINGKTGKKFFQEPESELFNNFFKNKEPSQTAIQFNNQNEFHSLLCQTKDSQKN